MHYDEVNIILENIPLLLQEHKYDDLIQILETFNQMANPENPPHSLLVDPSSRYHELKNVYEKLNQVINLIEESNLDSAKQLIQIRAHLLANQTYQDTHFNGY